MKQIVKTNFHGKEYSLETGRLAKQAHGSVLVRCGDTIILATAVGKKDVNESQDFFPLTVDYNEKMYAAGKIPGGFFKREGRPSMDQTLIARLIDRPIRPLFPEGFFNETHVVINVLSYDGITPPDSLSIVGASAALSISPLPFLGPVGAVIVGLIDGKLVINPSSSELESADLNLTIAGTKDAVMMVEAGANFVTEEKMLEAIEFGHTELKKLISLQEDLVKVAGTPKWDVKTYSIPEDIDQAVRQRITAKMKAAIRVAGKLEKYAAIDQVLVDLKGELIQAWGADTFAAKQKHVLKAYQAIESEEVRMAIVKENLRADNRSITQLRKISCEVGLLPRVHGSSLFTRGETQSLGVVTLGTGHDELMIDGLDDTAKKRFYLHYNFPSFSVGECGGKGSPGRREIGHGALAERALSATIPKHSDFPYTIRIVAETLESNGSSSMASVCSGCMALMQAGVPVKQPIAGVAMGLIKESSDYTILTDIAGLEDHLGDMDFKVAGSKDGITALQMDIKIQGITFQIMQEAMAQAKTARLEILSLMNGAISEPSKEMATFAPKIETIMISPDKIGMLIGPGGRVIKGITAETGVTIDIDESGKVLMMSPDTDALNRAKKIIDSLVRVPKVGDIFEAKVTKITNFGAFVEINASNSALLHISRVATERVNRVEDYLKEGQIITVEIEGIDEKGRINVNRPGI